MSLLTDDSDYTKAFERYADSVVSIFRGNRSVAGNTEQPSKKSDDMTGTIHCSAFVERSQFAEWLTRAIGAFIRNLLPTRSIYQGKAGLPAPTRRTYISLKKQHDCGVFCEDEIYFPGA